MDNASRKRAAEGYEPRFDLDSEYGRQGEMFVQDVAEAIRSQRVEVKRDARWAGTGNLFIEYECLKVSGRWEKSGIAITDASVWAFVLGDTETAIFIPTELLRGFCRELYRKGDFYHLECVVGSHPTRGVKVPLVWLLDRLVKHQLNLRRGAA